MEERVDHLIQEILTRPQVECQLRHYWAPGLYAREINISAGITVVGAVHKTENLICVSLGRLRVDTPEGWIEVGAGDTLVCAAGRRNAVHAIENSRWTNFFANPTNERDPDTLVELLTFCKASELLGGTDNIQIKANQLAPLKEG